MAWCRQATSHYLSKSWPRSLSLYGVTRDQWVKIISSEFQHHNCKEFIYFYGAISSPTAVHFHILLSLRILPRRCFVVAIPFFAFFTAESEIKMAKNISHERLEHTRCNKGRLMQKTLTYIQDLNLLWTNLLISFNCDIIVWNLFLKDLLTSFACRTRWRTCSKWFMHATWMKITKTQMSSNNAKRFTDKPVNWVESHLKSVLSAGNKNIGSSSHKPCFHSRPLRISI